MLAPQFGGTHPRLPSPMDEVRRKRNGENGKNAPQKENVVQKRPRTDNSKEAIGEIFAAKKSGDWEYVAARLEEMELLLNRDVMTAFFSVEKPRPPRSVCEKLAEASADLAMSEIRRANGNFNRKFYLAHHLIMVVSWQIPQQFAEVEELLCEMFANEIPSSIGKRLAEKGFSIHQKKVEYDARNRRDSRTRTYESDRESFLSTFANAHERGNGKRKSGGKKRMTKYEYAARREEIEVAKKKKKAQDRADKNKVKVKAKNKGKKK